MSELFSKIEELLVTEESKETLKKIIEYSRKYNEGIEKNYQKCFRDDIGRKYFIDIHKWRDIRHPYTGELIEGGYEFTTQLSDKNTDKPIDLNLFSGWIIEEAEATIERIWKTQFRYYDKYSSDLKEFLIKANRF